MRLRRSRLAGPGIRRRRRGSGFSYYIDDGATCTDPAELARIRAPVIPPAWTDVWICPDPRGHIQAVGTDAAGRRQYRYHDVWRVQRDAVKFDHMLEVAAALPRLRRAVRERLAGRGLSAGRVLAVAAALFDLGAFRIGGEEYASTETDADQASWHATACAAVTLAEQSRAATTQARRKRAVAARRARTGLSAAERDVLALLV